MNKFTEQESRYDNLEHMSALTIVSSMNNEDITVAYAVKDSLSQISRLVDAVYDRVQSGGRLFYIGAGTSGRLGILDASECPPTFGVEDLVFGIIAGGDGAIRKAVEFAEDNVDLAWQDLQKHNISNKDCVVGIAASGSTPYVVGGLKASQNNNVLTGCLTCNLETEVARYSDYPVEIVVGQEFLTGSTRLKAGTAQKMVLNMISTALMIKLGRVKGNKMVDMQIANNKLVNRGIEMVINETGISHSKAKYVLKKVGSVRKAIAYILKNNSI